MRTLSLALLSLMAFSACQAGSPVQLRPALRAQAFLPHDPGFPTTHPSANPCQTPHFGTQAFMPHDPDFPTTSPSANPCPCQHSLQTQAILPPDLNPGNPSHCHG